MYLCYSVFFKQKTAYEMRISDWSSDVCSSDLHIKKLISDTQIRIKRGIGDLHDQKRDLARHRAKERELRESIRHLKMEMPRLAAFYANTGRYLLGTPRSEEHTSELQSLMRISYAVFCLKKQKINTKTKANKNNI